MKVPVSALLFSFICRAARCCRGRLSRLLLAGVTLASWPLPLAARAEEGRSWSAECDPDTDYAAVIESWKKDNPPDLSPAVTEPDLLARLLALRDAGQVVRQNPASIAESMQTDLRNTTALLSIVEEFGWPTVDVVGDEGAEAAFLVAQHTIDHAVMRRFRGLVEQELRNGRVPGRHFAYLFDRTEMNNGGLQAYGTQLTCDMTAGKFIPMPLRDASNVDALRAAVHMYPLGLYVCSVNQTVGHLCRLPDTDAPAPE